VRVEVRGEITWTVTLRVVGQALLDSGLDNLASGQPDIDERQECLSKLLASQLDRLLELVLHANLRREYWRLMRFWGEYVDLGDRVIPGRIEVTNAGGEVGVNRVLGCLWLRHIVQVHTWRR